MMKKFNDLLYIICNSNELNVFDSTQQKVLRSVLFQDQNITAIHITEKLFFYADHSNFIFAVKLTDLEVSKRANHQNQNMEKKSMIGHSSWVLQLMSDERFLYSCSDDKSVMIWDLVSRRFPCDSNA